MSFVAMPPRRILLPVAKAKNVDSKPRKTGGHRKTPVTRAERKAADELWKAVARFGTSARIGFVNGVRYMKTRAQVEALVGLLAKGDVEGVLQKLGIDLLNSGFQAMADSLEKGAQHTKDLALEDLPTISQPAIDFSATNARVRANIQHHTGNLIRQVTDEARSSVRQLVLDSMQKARPPRVTAGLIRNTIGLNQRYAKAVENYEFGLVEAGEDPARAQTLSGLYADRLVDDRALTIARTEQANAINIGQQTVWEQARDSGTIEARKVQRKWIIDPVTAKDCPICEPMDGQERDLDEPFETGEGELIDQPTAHPNCNCLMLFVYEGEE